MVDRLYGIRGLEILGWSIGLRRNMAEDAQAKCDMA